MSMLWCGHCPDLVDSDDDPDCFVEHGPYSVLCEACRELRLPSRDDELAQMDKWNRNEVAA